MPHGRMPSGAFACISPSGQQDRRAPVRPVVPASPAGFSPAMRSLFLHRGSTRRSFSPGWQCCVAKRCCILPVTAVPESDNNWNWLIFLGVVALTVTL